MIRDKAVYELAGGGCARYVVVQPKRRPAPCGGGHPSHRVRALEDFAVGRDQVDRSLELLTRNFWKPMGNRRILKRDRIDNVAEASTPSCEPVAAEATLAVENQNRLLHLAILTSRNAD